jgi:hypothetical protein
LGITEYDTVSLDHIAGENVIFVKAAPNPNLTTMRKSLGEVADLMEKWDCNKVLFDLTDTKTIPGIIDLYRLSKEINRIEAKKDLKGAFVTPISFSGKMAFIMRVLRSRGLNVSNFFLIDQAKSWISK